MPICLIKRFNFVHVDCRGITNWVVDEIEKLCREGLSKSKPKRRKFTGNAYQLAVLKFWIGEFTREFGRFCDCEHVLPAAAMMLSFERGCKGSVCYSFTSIKSIFAEVFAFHQGNARVMRNQIGFFRS